MKNRNLSFYSMVFLALALMGLIIVTQLFTDQSTKTLGSGNIQAVETYKVNNRMQIIVNLSFDLQSKLSDATIKIDSNRGKQLYDSVFMLGYNSSILNTAISKFGYPQYAKQIDNLVKEQVDHSTYILITENSGNRATRDSLTDSLTKAQYGDKVYAACLRVQKLLEENLEQTLKKNTEQAGMLSNYNRVTAIVAILAILIMATIIIKRQSQQVKLISELRIAEITALKSKSAKDEFVANMSHELRTPLNALIGFSNLLNQTELNKSQQEYVDVIRSGGYNLLNIVNDVLDLSKIEAGKLRLVNKPFNIASVLANIEKMFSATVQEKKLMYEWHIDEKIPLNMKGDSERLKQILINLIGNAIKFTSTGGIQLNTGIVWMDEESGMYKLGFTIKDSGAGIPKEKIQTIFERFEQLEHVTTRQHGGTGLGLTIVKNLVEKMGGAISVYSEVGVGSEFSFTCIFEKAGSSVIEEEQNIYSSFSLENCRLLAAEDNKANQTLLKHLLGKYNASVRIVENGLEVLNYLKQEQFDLVLMDIQMPLMDGYTTIAKIRNDLKSTVPVIAMTAYVSEDEIKKCMDAGFTEYMAKPIEEAVLLGLLAKFTGRQKVMDQKTDASQRSDLGFLKELVGDDPDAISEIIKEMKDQWSLDKTDLQYAVKDENVKEIKRILHRIKSTFSPLGPGHEMYLEVANNNGKLVLDDGNIDADNFNQMIVKIDEFTGAL